MPNIIYSGQSESFLDWGPFLGELIALDNLEAESSFPVILVIPNGIRRRRYDEGRVGAEEVLNRKKIASGINLSYTTSTEERQEWTLFYSPGNAIALWSPKRKGKDRIPSFDNLTGYHYSINPYPVDVAVKGKDAIQEYLKRSSDGLDYYAECLNSGGLVTRRSPLEGAIQRVGLSFLLKPQLRFRN